MAKIVHTKISVTLRTNKTKGGNLTVPEAKKLIGWKTEKESGKDYGTDYALRDYEGNKVRLLNNPTNRPFRIAFAKRYASEIKRGKWSMNGEAIIIDNRNHVQNGQHRLTGFILAEQDRKQDAEGWASKGPATIPVLIVVGIDSRPDVVNTIDTGKGRTDADRIFRGQAFGKKYDTKEKKKLSNIYGKATRLAWLRAGGKQVSSAPHFPPTEAEEFRNNHVKLLEAVEVVYGLEGGGSATDGRLISNFLPLGTASALCYLMATSLTDPDKFDAKGPVALNYKLWDQAVEFWTTFASGEDLKKTNPIFALRKLLPKMESSSARGRDEINGTVANAWNLWADGKKGEAKDIKLTRTKNKTTGKIVFATAPRMGGLDVEIEEEAKPEPKASKKDSKGKGSKKDSKGNKSGKGSKGADTEPKKDEKAPFKTSQAKKGKWAVKDSAWVKDSDGEHWKGTLTDVAGENCILTAYDDGKSYEAKVKNLSLTKPKK